MEREKQEFKAVICGLLGCDTVWSCGWLPAFWRNVMIPLHPEDGGDNASKMLVTTYKTTWHHNPEDHNEHLQCFENLKSLKIVCSNIFVIDIISFRISP
jgi:hypothetical protein